MSPVLIRYLGRMLLARAAVLLLGLSALMVILEFLAEGDQVIAAGDGVVRPILYYTVLRLPELLAELIPITAMLAALLTFAELARHSELTALHAAGLSKAQLASAVIPVALLIAGLQFAIEDRAVPVAVAELRAWGIGDYGSRGNAAGISWLWHGKDIVRVRAVVDGGARLIGVTVFERDPQGNLVAQIEAANAVHEGTGWVLHDLTRTSIATGTVERLDRLAWPADLDPNALVPALAHPRETPLAGLIEVSRTPGLGTQPAYRYELWLHERIAAPLTTVAMILLTVALARPVRNRVGQGLWLATGVGVGYLCWTFDGLVLTFGDLGLLPPVLAAWTPVPVFLAIAGSVVLHDERRRRRHFAPAGVARSEASG